MMTIQTPKNSTYLRTIIFIAVFIPCFFIMGLAASSWGEETSSPDKPAGTVTAAEPASPPEEETAYPYALFDDQSLLDGYAERYREEPREVLLAMLQDETLDDFRVTAAVRVFREKFCEAVFSQEKKFIEKILLRRLSRTDSVYAHIEIMHTLCRMDRYKYFKSMVPILIQKLDHYNTTANELAFARINDIITAGYSRTREARIVFNVLRKNFFLMRRRLAKVTEPNERLKQKLKLLRWAVKILGNQELKRLPNEVIQLL
ncbi:MAG: hypothetical protein WC552_05940 [Candidatus Omnitrophota bacterium]